MSNFTAPISNAKRNTIRALVLTIASVVITTAASAQGQYPTAEKAVEALVTAVRSENLASMTSVLGRRSADILQSGDDVADAKTRAAFLVAYEVKHQLVSEGNQKNILMLGNVDWPFPIPIVQRNGAWQFDTAAGREEVLYRRIGANELDAIQVCLAYVDAQNEYAAANPENSRIGSYARRIISSSGRKDGLYWPAEASEPRSPLGEAMALATLEGYRFGDKPSPYHGYFYKILTAQGPTAPGGAVDYVVKDQMIGGFALVAYPAEYGVSGVMTFQVNNTGAVFQKDLGPRTERLASRLTLFNPDHTWKRVTGPDLEGAK